MNEYEALLNSYGSVGMHAFRLYLKGYITWPCNLLRALEMNKKSAQYCYTYFLPVPKTLKIGRSCGRAFCRF